MQKLGAYLLAGTYAYVGVDERRKWKMRTLRGCSSRSFLSDQLAKDTQKRQLIAGI